MPRDRWGAALLLMASLLAGSPAECASAAPAGAEEQPADPPAQPSPPLSCPADEAAAHAVRKAERTLVTFAASPFPYDGMIPGRNVPFMERDTEGAFHESPRGGRLREEVYADKRSVIFAPAQFDPRREDARLILFFHGNCAQLARDVLLRQRVPQQLRDSRFNAALVAPQMASDALDSSAGHFWNAGFLDRYLDEAARHLAERSRKRFTAAEIERLPVVIVAYSGGYLPAAYSLSHAAASRHRIEGVVLLDALFGEDSRFARWIERPTVSSFFVSLYSKSSSDNNAVMIERLRGNKLAVEDELPDHIGPGSIAFAARLDASHKDFVSDDGTKDPLADVLRRLKSPQGEESDSGPRKVAARHRVKRSAEAGSASQASADDPR